MPTHVTFRHIQPTYFPDISPRRINCGNCFNWALIAKWMYPGLNIQLCSVMDEHAFIKLGDRYFDSEHLNGTTEWRECVSWQPEERLTDDMLRIEDEVTFIDFWTTNGGCRVWNKMDVMQTGEIRRRRRINRTDDTLESVHFVPPLVPRAA